MSIKGHSKGLVLWYGHAGVGLGGGGRLLEVYNPLAFLMKYGIRNVASRITMERLP